MVSVFCVTFVARCVMDASDWVRDASMSDAMRKVRSNL